MREEFILSTNPEYKMSPMPNELRCNQAPSEGTSPGQTKKKNNKTEVILVTGGAGFVGSHTLIELLQAGYEVVVVDSCIRSKPPQDGQRLPAVLERVEDITGKRLTFHMISLLDRDALRKVPSESIGTPLDYYHNNITGTVTLLQVMCEVGCKRLVFSSSSTVYGSAKYFPTDEEHPTGVDVRSPYGQSKYVCEQMIKDLYVSDKEWKVVLLRYFNPVGAHESGLIGEDPLGVPMNLMPYIAQCAVGRRELVQVFGGDWDTPDGTCVRDYIHVMDLAEGHKSALEKLFDNSFTGVKPYNLGCGRGVSVLEMVTAFSKACGQQIPAKIVKSTKRVTWARRFVLPIGGGEPGWSASRTVERI
ncbi:UDP-glucose 4-epimerase-like 1 [Homarus americanus]|uniref:UDP-N-acetylglucosamine 4-epimerase n=1 Tax=Homarus americanus TaxID=6706 RepID=A0A8J5MWU9_HOMAM|nr:UDP-glucose 4-epimerase-like 1 [Homarus americanus]